MTPRSRSDAGSPAMATYAPRILNAPIGWRLSALRKTRSSGRPIRHERRADRDAAQDLRRGADGIDADELDVDRHRRSRSTMAWQSMQ